MADVTGITSNYWTGAKENNALTLQTTMTVSTPATVTFSNLTGYDDGDRVILVIDPAGTKEVVSGIKSGNTLTGVVRSLEGTAAPHNIGVTVIDYTTASHWETLIKGLRVSHEENGGLKSNTVGTNQVQDSSVTAAKLNPALLGGYLDQTTLPTSTVYNGNGSYTHTYPSSIAALKTPGYRNKYVRTTAANTYMGGLFNGTNHYFTKTSPTGTLGTFTNNFTLKVDIEPTVYALGMIAGRIDAATTNGFYLRIVSDGTIKLTIHNGGAGNFREQATIQAVPLNKKTNVTVTWASGTLLVYFNGILVPLNSVATGGTAPTTIGAGVNDFSIGRGGAFTSQYYTGYISNFAVFDTVLSAATIKDYHSQPLLGSETNCIGAWSLNNTAVNQQAPGTNDLTATNGVSYTQHRSPFTTTINGTNDGVTSHSITQSVSADGLTEVVQTPEGVTIPTRGTIASMQYSPHKNPYGFPSAKNKWQIIVQSRTEIQVAATAPTVYNLGSLQIALPIGDWILGGEGDIGEDSGAAGRRDVRLALSLSPTTVDNLELCAAAAGIGSAFLCWWLTFRGNVRVETQTTYYLVEQPLSSSGTLYSNPASYIPTRIIAENAHL